MASHMLALRLRLAVTHVFQSHFSGHSESRDDVLLQKGPGRAAPSWAQKEERTGVFDKGKSCFYWTLAPPFWKIS